ncbi:MAG: PIN domain-containing protein [Balneolaceae bacterium]|nr:PIN domain-containing protein [Balneolaceae bacterium]
MNADYKVLLDANVLANYAVCDLYLRLAEKPRLLLPKWTEEILNEVHKTHVEKLGWSPELADTFRQALNNAFPEAFITGYEELIPLMTNDEKDRHVLAAAVREKLDIIITFNLKDFKPENLKKWGIRALHPQDYLLTLYSMNPQVVIMKLNQIARKKEEELEDTIIQFGKVLPAFSTRLLEDMGK